MHGVGRGWICEHIITFRGKNRQSHCLTALLKFIRKLRSKGIAAALGYIDDFWVSAETEEGCFHTYKHLIELLEDLKFVVNRDKCVPFTARLTFMGIELDTDAQPGGICRMTIPTTKRDRGIKLRT
jgi:hypothetical protein